MKLVTLEIKSHGARYLGDKESWGSLPWRKIVMGLVTLEIKSHGACYLGDKESRGLLPWR